METKPSAASGLGKPPAANPVMDVVAAPPTDQSAQPKRAAEPGHEIDPLDKLAAQDKAEQALHEVKHKLEPAKTAQPKHGADHSGTSLAIIATVIIVLGLAALATYAYLQTAK